MNNKDKILWIKRTAVFIFFGIMLQPIALSGRNIVITRSVVDIITSVMTCALVSELSVLQFITVLIEGIFFIILFPTLRKVIGERRE